MEHFGTVESIWSEDFRSITKKLASAMLKTLGPHHTHKADRMPEANWLHHPGQGTAVTDSSWLRDDCIFLKNYHSTSNIAIIQDSEPPDASAITVLIGKAHALETRRQAA